MKPTYEELQKQIDRLLSEIRMPKNSDEAASMALIGMAWLDANDKNKLTEVHNKYLTEVRAQAVEDKYNFAAKAFREFGEDLFSQKGTFLSDAMRPIVQQWADVLEGQGKIKANQLRQPAKAGEV